MCIGEGSYTSAVDDANLTSQFTKRTRIYSAVCRAGVGFILAIGIFKDTVLTASFGLFFFCH